MKICMNKRQFENDNVTDVSKKMKIEMNDDGDDSNADPEDEKKVMLSK